MSPVLHSLQDHFQHQHPSTIVLGVAAVATLGYYVLRSIANSLRYRAIAKEHGCKPINRLPQAWWDPFGMGFGLVNKNAVLIKEGRFLPETQRRYKSVGDGVYALSFNYLGTTIVTTAEPENIKAMLATQFKKWSLTPSRKEAFHPAFGHGIFTTDGKDWEISRALLRPNFSRSQVGDLDTFEEHITKMIAKIPTDGSEVDLQKLFFMLTLDSATEFLFGHSTNVLSSEGESRGVQFGKSFDGCTTAAGFRTRTGFFGKYWPDKQAERDIAFVHEFVREYVDKTLEYAKSPKVKVDGETSRYVFLEELAKTGYDAKRIQDELLNVLLAGRDTTASLLSHVWYVLSHRPDIYEKLHAEVANLQDERPTFEQIKTMKYLQWVLNETLRLWPIVPLNSRYPLVDTVLPRGGGPDGQSPILVKAGQQVNYHVYVMHRREDIYGPDAAEFKPERWEKLRPSWDYLPFNGGPRICIGQQFALTEASYTTIRLLQAFKAIKPLTDPVYRDSIGVTLSVGGGVGVSLTPN